MTPAGMAIAADFSKQYRGEKNMNEIQYCLKSIIVATCVSAFRRIKPYLAISPIFCHQWTRSDHLVLSSFRLLFVEEEPTSRTLFLPANSISLWILSSFYFYHPSPARSPSSLPLFPLREQWECFLCAPSVAPCFSVARAQNWLEILAEILRAGISRRTSWPTWHQVPPLPCQPPKL